MASQSTTQKDYFWNHAQERWEKRAPGDTTQTTTVTDDEDTAQKDYYWDKAKEGWVKRVPAEATDTTADQGKTGDDWVYDFEKGCWEKRVPGKVYPKPDGKAAEKKEPVSQEKTTGSSST